MAFYAVDDDDLIDAADAEPRKIYWCLDCFGPVKRRVGKNRLSHFYHLKTTPQCRLYSKTEDHLLAQIQLQKSFPEGALQMERPFIQIDRVADLCWEKEKVVFEIQCSPMSEKEAEMRIHDYRSVGYEVIWLLDDKRYNKRVARPAEEFLRQFSTYYLLIEKGLTSRCYDQFEIFSDGKRVRRGRRIPLDLQKIRNRPQGTFNEELFPGQIVQLKGKKYLSGDRMDRALQGHHMTMHHWKMLELEPKRGMLKGNFVKEWLKKRVVGPYLAILQRWINQLH
jgi:competence protein CoiA